MREDWYRLLHLVVPMLTASLSDILLSFADTAIVGRLGVTQLAAVAVAAAFLSVITQVLYAAAIGYQITVARQLGAGERERAGASLRHAGLLLLPLGALGMTILLLSRPLVSLLAGDPSVAREAYVYLTIRSPALVLLALAVLVRMTFDADRQPRWGMNAALLSNVVNVALSYGLVFGVGPLPALGLAGAALGSTLASGIYLGYLARAFSRYPVVPLARFPWDRSLAEHMVRLSGPEVVNALLDYVGNLMFVWVTGLLGAVALAGGRIAFIVLLIFFTISMTFGVGIQILMGRSLGKGDLASASRLLLSGRTLTLLLMTIPAAALIVWPRVVVRIFTENPVVVDEGATAIQLVGLLLPMMAWTTAHVGALRALGRTKQNMYVNVISIWAVQIPVAWLLGVRFGLGLGGIYLGFVAYFLVRALWSHLLAVRALQQVDGQVVTAHVE